MQKWRKFLMVVAIMSVSAMAFAKEQVHEFQLKNGLKILVKEDHRAPIAITEVWYKVGSSYEPLGVTGISHALEHMMFRGSKNVSSSEFLQTIAENGGEQNAFTYYDYTGYYELMGADKLPIAFKLEADRMRNLLLNKDDFAKEIQVVMEERRMRTEDNPQAQTSERFSAAAFLSNGYHHPVIGWMSDLQQMTIEDLKKWYETWYAPNNAILVVVGDVKPNEVYDLANKYFGPLKPSVLPAVKAQPEVRSLGTRTVEVNLPAKLPFLLMGYNTPVVKTAQQAWEPYALMVLSGILGGGDSSRLEKNLVRGKQIATNVDVDYELYFRLDSLFAISAVPAQGHTIDEVKNAILNEIKLLQQQPVTQAELERIKAQVIANKVYERDSIEAQANELGSLAAIGLPWQEADNGIKQIKAITAEQVQAVAKKYLVPERLTVAVLNPLPMTPEQEKQQQQGQSSGGAYVH